MRVWLITLIHLIGIMSIAADTASPITERKRLVLDGKDAQVTIELGGGSITDFHLKALPLNPLMWGAAGHPDKPRPMGHFLCLDRWGQPSEAEQKNGMPFHGEAANVEWQVLESPKRVGPTIQADMTATLPLAGLRIERIIELAESDSWFVVRERVTNVNKLGRIFNMVQHPTIAPPFLDESTIVDSNARKGFAQGGRIPGPNEVGVEWPSARQGERTVDLRRLNNDDNPNVVSFTVGDDFGWVTAANPSKGLLIGYCWKRSEYPWFNAWRHVEHGKPAARGLEFGTTGLHQPFPILVKTGRIFGQPLYEYIDSGETVTKSYVCFLARIPADFKGIARITHTDNKLVLRERDSGAARDVSVRVSPLPWNDDRK